MFTQFQDSLLINCFSLNINKWTYWHCLDIMLDKESVHKQAREFFYRYIFILKINVYQNVFTSCQFKIKLFIENLLKFHNVSYCILMPPIFRR